MDHVILVSAKDLLVLTLGLSDFRLGLDNIEALLKSIRINQPLRY